MNRALVFAIALLGLAGVAAVLLFDGPSHLERARQALADDEAFSASSTAGEALLRSSVELEKAGDGCDDDDRSCDRFLTAAAVARVASVQVLECRRPDVFTFRAAFRSHLDALANDEDPLPPPLPSCA